MNKNVPCPVCYGTGYTYDAEGKKKKHCVFCGGIGRTNEPDEKPISIRTIIIAAIFLIVGITVLIYFFLLK